MIFAMVLIVLPALNVIKEFASDNTILLKRNYVHSPQDLKLLSVQTEITGVSVCKAHQIVGIVSKVSK